MMPPVFSKTSNSLPSAIEYLLSRGGHGATVEQELNDWIAVTKVEQIEQLLDSGGIGTWPRTNDAIVLFQGQSGDVPYVDVDGFQRPNMINRYYPLEDWARRLVYDTATGEVVSFQGRVPTSWASYKIALPKPTEYKESRTPVEEDNIPGIIYEHFPQPRRMYVSNLAGANKVDFGKAANWNDIGKAVIGHLEYGTEVYILGQAHHPMLPVGAVFYMDAAAMGIFKKTGRASQSYGYSKADLNDHLLSKTTPRLQTVEPEIEIIPVKVEPEDTSFKDTYKDFCDQQGNLEIRRFVSLYKKIPKTDIFTEIILENGREIEASFVWIKDCANLRHPHKFRVGAEVDLAGFFTYNGKLLGRPAKVVNDGDWFGIDMDWLVLKLEAYNTATTVQERVALKTLRMSDYFPAARGYAEATFNQLVKRRKRKINK